MLFLRYLFSIIFSFLIHSLAFSSAPPPSLYLDLNATQKSSIAIQLISPVKKEELLKQPIKEQQTPVKEAASKPQKVIEKGVKKTAQKPPFTPVKKQQEVAIKPFQEEPKSEVIIEKQVKSKPKNKLDEKPKEPKNTDKPTPVTSASSTKQSAPKMVKKVTFSARPAPIAYPHSAKRRNIEGVVLVEVWLDEQGKQTKQRIISSSGHQILDKAALKGISQWQFSRQQDDGHAIAYRVQVPINFGLK